MTKETELYAPVKLFLETRGYQVKAEVKGCDVVATSPGAPTVVVELKLGFSLDLVMQGIARLNVADDVYLAISTPDTPTKRKNWRALQRGYVKLCKMLGLGLMLVNIKAQNIKVLIDPQVYIPRKNKKQQTRLMMEFVKREGDPNTGGTNRTKIITAYRQDALRCAVVLNEYPELKVSMIKQHSGVANAGVILQRNYYNWFERTARGVYALSPQGREGLETFASVLPPLQASRPH